MMFFLPVTNIEFGCLMWEVSVLLLYIHHPLDQVGVRFSRPGGLKVIGESCEQNFGTKEMTDG